MARAGMVNVGQLVRQAHGDDGVVLVGFGSHRGTVIAGDEWGAPMERMRVPTARRELRGSAMHDASRRRRASCSFDGSDDGGVAGSRRADRPSRDRRRLRSEPRAVGQLRADDHAAALRRVPVHRRDASRRSAAHAGARRGEVPETFPSGV